MSLESVWWFKLVNIKGLFTELFNWIVLIQVIYSLSNKTNENKNNSKYIVVIEMQLTPFVELDVKS